MIFLISFLASHFAFAGHEVGNGGDGIVCLSKAKKIESVRMLDFHEKGKDWKEFKAEKAKDYTEVLTQLLGKLEKVAPELAKQYQARLKAIPSDLEFTDDDLVNVKDSKHVTEPAKDKDCHIQQVAIRKTDGKQNSHFVIQDDLWKKMDVTNQAGLILHEIIYEHLVLAGESDSRHARWLTAQIFDPNFEKISKDEFWSRVKSQRMPIYQSLR